MNPRFEIAPNYVIFYSMFFIKPLILLSVCALFASNSVASAAGIVCAAEQDHAISPVMVMDNAAAETCHDDEHIEATSEMVCDDCDCQHCLKMTVLSSHDHATVHSVSHAAIGFYATAPPYVTYRLYHPPKPIS